MNPWAIAVAAVLGALVLFTRGGQAALANAPMVDAGGAGAGDAGTQSAGQNQQQSPGFIPLGSPALGFTGSPTGAPEDAFSTQTANVDLGIGPTAQPSVPAPTYSPTSGVPTALAGAQSAYVAGNPFAVANAFAAYQAAANPLQAQPGQIVPAGKAALA